MASWQSMHPRAIVEGFEVEVTATGLVLRHAEREALQLSGVAAAVWRQADGLLSVDELAALVGADVDSVWLALDELADAELMVARVAPPAASRGMSRREVLAMAAVGAVTAGLAPVVSAATTDATQAKKEQEKKRQPSDEGAAQKEQRVKDQALQSPSAQEAEAKVVVKQEQDAKASAQRKEQDVKVSAQKQEQSQKRESAQEQEVKASAASRQEREVKLSSSREQEEKASAQRLQEQDAKVGAQRQEQTQKAAKKPAQE